MAPKACATNGSFVSATAVRKVTASPMAACLSETARRSSLNAHAMPSNANTPNADCSCSIMPPRLGDYGSGALQSAMPRGLDQQAAERRTLTTGQGSATRQQQTCSGRLLTIEKTGQRPLTIPSMISADSSSLLRHRSFLLFLLTRSFSRFSSQVAAVAIRWQIYDLTGSAFDLGMVGLVQFL